MKCPNCQQPNPDGARFCNQCGTKMPAPCPNCGHQNPPGSKFCNNCGNAIRETGSSSAKAAGPATFDTGTQSPPGSRESDSLRRFIPRELATKLETARASEAMVGERRVVTSLFCDVVGSTTASEQLDPEEWTEIMNGTFEQMIIPIYRYEGTVARLMGDAILAFFGAPIAHEDDPQRAVLAGLEIVEGMQPYRAQVQEEWGIEFDVRVGINTGLVVVGAVGSDLRMEYTAMGDAVNLAARMEQTAKPGTVQIAADTYEQVTSLFEFEALGAIRVKGKTEPVEAFRVLGRKATPARQRGIEGLGAPLVGRAAERGIMEQAFANLDKGLGGIVYLLGEAGLGKSRLIEELKRSTVETQSFNWHESLSLSYETKQPYALLRRLARRVLGARADESPQEMRKKISRLVEVLPQAERPTAKRVFESLFGLEGEDGDLPLEGETFKGLLYTVMAALWERRAQSRPVVLVCDDLHWSDPASLSLLRHLYSLTDRAALLLLCAMRPEREAPAWQAMQVAKRDFPHRYREIRLQPLDASESGELVDRLLRISHLPDGVRRRIMEKSEGNPYFVEEVVRTLIDQGTVVQDESGVHWRATGNDMELDIPGNLQTLLVARIDRLTGEPRRTLQVASVVGRSFYHRVLQRLVDVTVDELDQHLLSLQRVQLVQEVARLPEVEYQFRHALTQEAAYGTILLKQRRTYHHRVAAALEALYPGQRQEMAGTLADHFFQARNFEKALDYYTLAGDEAFRLHAASEALKHYQRAIQCAAKIDASSERLVHFYTRRGRAYELDGQFDQALENYREMSRRAAEHNDERLKLASLAAQCILHATQTPLYDPAQARALAEEALALVQKLDDRATEAKVLWGMLLVETWGEGDNHKALEYGLRSLELARELGLKEQVGFTYTNLVNAHWNLDQLDAARQANQEAQAIWEELGNLPMLADAYTMKQSILLLEGNFEAVLEIARKSLRLSQSIGNVWNQLTAFHYMTAAYTERGEVRLALETSAENLQLVEETGFTMFLPGVLRNRLTLYLDGGGLDRARPLANELYRNRKEIIPIFRPQTMALIIKAKIAGQDVAQAQRVLDEAYQDSDLEESPIIYMGYLLLAEIHLYLVLDDFERALQRADYLVERMRWAGFRQLLPEALWLQGKANLALSHVDRARPILRDALTASREIGERRMRWRILGDLAQLEARCANLASANGHWQQAREVVNYIADHSPPDLQETFLALPEVRAILENPSSRAPRHDEQD